MVIVHSTYLYGIPIRMACFKKIPVFKEHLTQFIILEKKIIILDKSFLHLKRSIKN